MRAHAVAGQWKRMGRSRGTPLFEAIETYCDELTAFVRRKVTCPDLTADIMQETWIRLASVSTPAAIENPRAFLYRIAGNLVIDHLRQQQTRAKYVAQEAPAEDVADAQPSAESAIDAKQRLALLARAVDELPPRCRQVFLLRMFEGLDQADIAGSLGISRNMVEKHLRKALLHCATRLSLHD